MTKSQCQMVDALRAAILCNLGITLTGHMGACAMGVIQLFMFALDRQAIFR